jgi:hypothetical protein
MPTWYPVDVRFPRPVGIAWGPRTFLEVR